MTKRQELFGVDTAILFHYVPPIGCGLEEYFGVLEGNTQREVSFSDVCAHEGVLLTHSVANIIERARQCGRSLPQLIDLSVALRLVAGQPRSDFEHHKEPWNVAHRILMREPVEPALRGIDRVLAGLPVDGVDLREMARVVIPKLEALWEECLVLMESEGEIRRFLEIEAPCSRLFYDAAFRGVRVDQNGWRGAIRELEREYFSVLRELRVGCGVDVDTVGRDRARLFSVLEAEGSTLRTAWPDNADPRDVVEYLRHGSKICNLLHRLWKAKAQKRLLLEFGVHDCDLVNPVYEVVGTVTGRTMVRNPGLQNLSKHLRFLLVPPIGCRFVYVDYDFFEPMIMTALSGSAELAEVCRSDDLYQWLARACGYDGRRKEFKMVFLGFSYGMGGASMRSWAQGLLGIDHVEAARVVGTVELALSDLIVWKESIYERTERDGRIGSLLGNYRRRKSIGSLDDEERRWCVSQVVQGTASLVFKRALLRVQARLGDGVRLVLPVHDAALYAISSGEGTAIEEAIIEEFVQAARDYLPRGEASASIQEFSTRDSVEADGR